MGSRFMEDQPGSTRDHALGTSRKGTPSMTVSLLAGMPAAYYERHSLDEVNAHAGVVTSRRNALVAVEPTPGPSDGLPCQWLCVVTDDRAGLLSLLSAAI